MIEELKKYLPKGWQEAAITKGAFTRSRGIKNAEELLMLNVLYLTEGDSYQVTSALMKSKKNIIINKTATKKRIAQSRDWLKWLSENISVENGFTIAKPSFLGNKNVLLIDASDVSVKGTKAGDYWLHYSFDLFEYSYRSTEIITIEKEEKKLNRYAFDENDILIADKVYGTVQGIEYAKSCGSDYIVRLQTKSFTLYDENGDKVDIFSRIEGLKDLESMSLVCFYKNNGEFHKIRICIMKKDEKSYEESRLKSEEGENQTLLPSKESVELNKYILVATSLEYTEEQIFELYRARSQIECVFLHLKSFFRLSDVPSYREDSILTWLYGKLFLATLYKTIAKQSCFPSKGQ